jgi:3-oxoadipyl-CoA thiolase
MRAVFLCDAVRKSTGRFGGVLAHVRADDLAAIPIRELLNKNPNVEWVKELL